jgi:hypothetical protein
VKWLPGFALSYVGDAMTTNRRQYHVRCNECGQVVHHCTTGPFKRMRDHRDEGCLPIIPKPEQMIPFHRNQLGHLLTGNPEFSNLVDEVAPRISEFVGGAAKQVAVRAIRALFYMEPER